MDESYTQAVSKAWVPVTPKNFTTCFPVIEGQTPSETQSSHKFWKTDIRIEEIGNVTAGKAAEPALLSQDQRTPYRHRKTTGSAAHGDT